MSIYDVDYTDVGRQLTPPDKRMRRFLSFLVALLSPIQYLRDLWLGDYRIGSTALPWLDSTTYSVGDRVVYRGSAYESLQPGNLNNLPTDQTKWKLVQENFIGVFERVLYNGNKLTFEWAINKFFKEFGTTFRQPPNTSDIYLVSHVKPPLVFVSGEDEAFSSKVYIDRSTEFVVNTYTFTGYFNMSIMVPLAVFNALDTDPGNRESIVRRFADKYIIAGVIYNVVTY